MDMDSDDEITEVTEEMVEGVQFTAKQGKYSSGAPMYSYDNSGRRYQADQFGTRIMRCSRPPDTDNISWGKMKRPAQLKAIFGKRLKSRTLR